MATGRIGTTPVLRTRWSKEPAGGTTSLSGLDDYSVSLVYEVGYEAVYQNGALLSRGNDYTATNGTTITLTNATVAGDIIEVFANNVVPLTDTYSQSVADGKFVNNTIVDAKGDLIVGSAADTFTRLAVGSANQVLTVDSATTSGLKWATPAAGGKVLQVVNATYSTETTSSTSTYADTGLTATITPSSATSKVLVLVSNNGIRKDNDNSMNVKLLRGATDLIFLGVTIGSTATSTRNVVGCVAGSYLDSPNTTSATTYKTQFNSASNGASVRIQEGNSVSTITLLEIGA